MAGTSIATYLNPWKLRRVREAQRLDALRSRDGDNCARCRRPMRFDLPPGHDSAPKLEPILDNAKAGKSALDNFCLCHTRCNAQGADHTGEVTERVRRKAEAALFAKPRRKRTKKAA
jgi:hypothetical protein